MSLEGFAADASRTLTTNTIRFFGQIIGDRYRIERLLARGGMGHVYAGTEIDVDRPVAIKVLSVRDDSGENLFRRRFHREASIASRLAHPNIVTIYDYGETRGGDLYMVMEQVQGVSLHALLEQEGRIPPVRALNIAIQIARALRKAHREGAVHRDLKPDNIMIAQDDDGVDFVKVLDFGLVKIFSGEEIDGVEKQITAVGMMMGTPAYMPPEQACGELVDDRADMYSLGVLLFQMLAGRLPFMASSMVELVNMHLITPPPLELLAGCPPDLIEIVRRCLEKTAVRRYNTIDEVLLALKEVWRQLTDQSFGTDPTFVVRTITELEALYRPDQAPTTELAPEQPKSCLIKRILPFF